MTTIKTLAKEQGIQPTSLQRAIKRKRLGKFGINAPLPQEVVDALSQLPGPSQNRDMQGTQRINQDRPKPNLKLKTKANWFIKTLPVMSLPLLGLVSSWGVFKFVFHFSPLAVSIFAAFAFSSVYIGLTFSAGFQKIAKQRAYWISFAAMSIAALYNVMAFHLDGFGWIMAILRGVPFPVLAFFVADLVFNQKVK